ncbi:MAG: DUF4288 domain-containing protein [Cyclobacteriaceae bacterium]|nr:DUF4288 domain-containing protein [Cyclobacteriaceae bacterium]
MNWYIARFVYQIVLPNAAGAPQFDEQVRLVRADEAAWAWEKAHVLGRLGECTLENENNQSVQWKFVGVTNMYPLHDLADGAELFSDTWHPANGEEFLHTAQLQVQKAKGLLLDGEKSRLAC